MKSRKGRSDVDALALQYRRLEFLSRSPLQAILRCTRELQDFDDWPFAGTAGEVRVAPQYFAQVYQQDQHGVRYAKEWIAAHKLEDCELAHELVGNLMSVDHALLYDGLNILNTASFEVLAGRCYGLERAFEPCTEAGDWCDETKGRVRLHLLDRYDLSLIMSADAQIRSADLAVKREMQGHLQFEKCMKKATQSSRAEDSEDFFAYS